MGLLARKVRHSRWYSIGAKLAAECLLDLEAKDNKLSLWRVDEGVAEIEEIVVAIAATRDYLQDVDLALIEEDVVREAALHVEVREGATPYIRARDLHRVLVELTAEDVVSLATLIEEESGYRRYSRRSVRELMLEAIRGQRLSLSELKKDVQEHLLKYL